jgi:hypothetical protein
MDVFLASNPLRFRRLRGKIFVLAAVAAAAFAAPIGEASSRSADPPGPSWRGFAIETLSSAPDQVSGGDVLLRILVPGRHPLERVRVFRNGEDVTDALAPEGGRHALIGLVRGLRLGRNVLGVSPNLSGHGRAAQLLVKNHPIAGPIFSGPQQQPFVCTTARLGLGQPLVDNMEGIGIPVAREDPEGDYPSDARGYPTEEAEIVGWSKDCAAETRIEYRYRTLAGSFEPLADPTAPLPPDIAMTTTLEGLTVPYVVRWERGTVNRFVYSIAMLAPAGEEDPLEPDDALWNRRLVFALQGGVAIGHTQGTSGTAAMLPHDLLSLGYAVLSSTGLRTDTTYNLQLGGETALMLKEHFIEAHGVPLYTVGVGGSGGGVQQYVYGQNHPGLLDAAIPQYSYSDMVTQTIHVGDCELLEHYFDVTDAGNPKWLDVENRQAIQGLNASWHPENQSAGEARQWNLLYLLYAVLGLPVADAALPPPEPPALTECRRAWFGLSPLVMNPTFTNVDDLDKLAQGVEGVEWTHWADLVNIYGTGELGFARVPWDNVGVQYGLQALRDGVITAEEFLHLNANVGSWKESHDIATEGFPFVGDVDPMNFDPWSSRNMNLSPDGGSTPAPRREGDLDAIAAAYRSGMVFTGRIDIPVIDWRHYLEHELDMHHTHQSFTTRQRLIEGRGDADNQVIWFTDAQPARAFDQTPEAFEVIDEWMANIRSRPERGVAENRPPRAVDRCFTTEGEEIAAGDHVWDGILNDRPSGPCTERFEIHQTSRMVAGGPIRGGVFKCQLQTVARAISGGVYGSWVPTPAQRARLEEIFPAGVCDWTRPDAGRPPSRRNRSHTR